MMQDLYAEDKGRGVDEPKPYCRESRAAARRMQKDFLHWQRDMKQRKGEEGACACAAYEGWFSRYIEEHSRTLTPQQKQDFEALARRQGNAYGAWAKSHAEEQEQTAALALQDEVLAESREMLFENMLDDGISGQSLEQIMAAAREKARLQGLTAHESTVQEERSVMDALHAVFLQGIEAGEFDAVRHALRTHGMLLDAPSQHAVQERLTQAEHAVTASAQAEAQAEAAAKARRERIDATSEIVNQNADVTVGLAADIADPDERETWNLARGRRMLQTNEVNSHAAEIKSQFYRTIIQLCTQGEQYDPLEAIRQTHAFVDIDEDTREHIVDAIVHGRVRVDTSGVDDDMTLLSFYERLVNIYASPLQAVELLQHVCCGHICYATGAELMDAEKLLKKTHKILLHKLFQQMQSAFAVPKASPEAPGEMRPELLPVFIAQWSLYLQHCLEVIKEGDIGLIMKRTSAKYLDDMLGRSPKK